MPSHTSGGSRHNFSAYGTYSFEGDGWGLTAGLGGSWEGHVEEGGSGLTIHEQDFYQAGINLTFGNFGIGVVGEYYNDAVAFDTSTGSIDKDLWVVGIGASYTMDAWTFGLQYSHREDDTDIDGSPTADDFEVQQDRIVGTVNYALGPGINIDGELGYTWIDSDPEFEDAITTAPSGLDDYGGFEIGLGTNITF